MGKLWVSNDPPSLPPPMWLQVHACLHPAHLEGPPSSPLLYSLCCGLLSGGQVDPWAPMPGKATWSWSSRHGPGVSPLYADPWCHGPQPA